MKRFFGLMPSKEVEIEKIYKDKDFGDKIIIQAGPKGWTIIFSDHSTNYKDCDDTAENNFQEAFKVMKKSCGNIYEFHGKIKKDKI